MTHSVATELGYKVIQQSEYSCMPWKNGLGETFEIVVNQNQQGQRFRISQATVVEDGIFSDFSGLDRTLVLLSGEGMRLSHRSVEDISTHTQLNAALDIARFAGGDHTYAELTNGRIEDLNIMVRETDTLSKVQVCFAPESMTITGDNRSLINAFYANQTCVITTELTGHLSLNAHSFLLIGQACELQLHQGSGVFIQIYPKP